MISHETIEEIAERSGGVCEVGTCRTPLGKHDGEHHHVYWRSQYKRSDRDEAWNLSYICHRCHYAIHSGGDVGLDRELKAIADQRRPDQETDRTHRDITRARRTRRKAYQKKVENFKESHNGLSPSQVAYRNQKAYLKNKQSLDTPST